MVGLEAEGEFLLGYSPCGMFEIVLRPVRGARRPPRPVPCPEPPRTPFYPPRSSPSPSQQQQQQQQQQQRQQRENWEQELRIPVSDGGIFYTPKIKQEAPEPLPPFTSLVKREPVSPPPRVAATESRIPPPRPPPPRWADTAALQFPPSYQGLVVTEAPQQSPSPPFGEVKVEQLPIGVRVTTRPSSSASNSEPPSAPEDLSIWARGVTRPHSISPFVRNVRVKKEDDDEVGDTVEEAVSCLLEFNKRTGLISSSPAAEAKRQHPRQEKMVRRFTTPRTSTPVSTPRRPPRDISPTRFVLPGPSSRRSPSPPRIRSRRVLPMDTPRPRPLLRPAALGAPPPPVDNDDDEAMAELPDIPESPASPTASDMTMISTLSTYYSSDEEEEDEEDEDLAYSEYEYGDPYEDSEPYSRTPPPDCDAGRPHLVCVPPAWGEMISGPPVVFRCILCHEDERHHAIRCRQCKNAPGCCACIWGYMRSRYNSGCPLCRAGDPNGDNPLAGNSLTRRLPPPHKSPKSSPRGYVNWCRPCEGSWKEEESTL